MIISNEHKLCIALLTDFLTMLAYHLIRALVETRTRGLPLPRRKLPLSCNVRKFYCNLCPLLGFFSDRFAIRDNNPSLWLTETVFTFATANILANLAWKQVCNILYKVCVFRADPSRKIYPMKFSLDILFFIADHPIHIKHMRFGWYMQCHVQKVNQETLLTFGKGWIKYHTDHIYWHLYNLLQWKGGERWGLKIENVYANQRPGRPSGFSHPKNTNYIGRGHRDLASCQVSLASV